jgi:plasmid maintenance system antidote protein VapI
MLDENVKILQNIMNTKVLNQVEIAKELNTSKQFISQILNGKRGISKNMLLKLKTVYPEFFVNHSQNITSKCSHL